MSGTFSIEILFTSCNLPDLLVGDFDGHHSFVAFSPLMQGGPKKCHFTFVHIFANY